MSASQFVCCVFLQCLEFVFLTMQCGCAGAVAPDSCSGTITTSFVGRKLCFHWVLSYFWGVTCFA